MYPSKEAALRELELAADMNPGLWVAHCQNAARAAESIAARCPDMDSDKAFVCGLLHDIGRREGNFAMRHTIDGYDYLMSKGWDEPARICLTHSFPVKDVNTDLAANDMTDAQYAFTKNFLDSIEYDDYDKLIILCDCLAEASGFCIIEKRLIDTARRYGVFPFSLGRWNTAFEYKAHFERLTGCSLYRLLPGIEECIYR